MVYKTDNGEIEARDFDRESRITIMDNATYVSIYNISKA